MFSNVLRDAELLDFARDAVAPLGAYLEEAADRPGRPAAGSAAGAENASGSPAPRASRSRRGRSLSRRGVDRSDAVKLVTALVAAA